MGLLIVFSLPVEAAEFEGRNPSLDEIMPRLNDHVWQFSSRNGWHQSLLAQTLDQYSGRDELGFIRRTSVVVPQNQLRSIQDAFCELIDAIRDYPDPFVEAIGQPSVGRDEIREYISQAAVSRSVNDDSWQCGNFFSYLVSQAAAVAESDQQGKSLLYMAVDS
jgi:hypothetical protein